MRKINKLIVWTIFLIMVTNLFPVLAENDQIAQETAADIKQSIFDNELIPYTGPLEDYEFEPQSQDASGMMSSGIIDTARTVNKRGKGYPYGDNDLSAFSTDQAAAALSSVPDSNYRTLTLPSFRNKINHPHMAGRAANSYVSTYTGDAQINFTDISLPGKNGLDLNLNRFYQSNQNDTENYTTPSNDLIVEPTTYFNERYALGLGWSLGFPSVEVRKSQLSDKYANKKLFYHDGTGAAYQVIADDVITGEQDEEGNYIYNGYVLYMNMSATLDTLRRSRWTPAAVKLDTCGAKIGH